MHASTEQLLTLRDGDQLSEGIAGHVAGCAECTSELAALISTRDALRALPPFAPPADRLDMILGRVDSGRSSRRARRFVAMAGLAASAVLAAVLLLRMPAPEVAGSPVSVVDAGSSQVAERPFAPQRLLAESQRLEALIDDYRRQQPEPSNPRLAGAVRGLEDQVAMVDYGLTYAAEADLDDEQFDQLWQQRVDLMNSIAHVRGAELRRVEYLEGLR